MGTGNGERGTGENGNRDSPFPDFPFSIPCFRTSLTITGTNLFRRRSRWRHRHRPCVSSLMLINRWFSRYVVAAILVDGKKKKISH